MLKDANLYELFEQELNNSDQVDIEETQKLLKELIADINSFNEQEVIKADQIQA